MLLHRITVTGFWQSHATQGGDARGGTRGTGSALRCIGRPVRRRTRGNGTIGREAGRAAGQSAVPPGAAPGPAQPLAAHVLCQRGVYGCHLDALPGRSSSGSLNEGYDISAGYNWTSRRGFGAGIVYSGGFLAAERNGIRRTSRIHYIAPEFVARQRAGRRWLFRESAGIGYGRYIRSYGDTSGSRGGVGIHESASVEFMLGRHIGLGAGISGQWLIVDSPDVDDGAELSLFGIFRFQFGGGLRVYF